MFHFIKSGGVFDGGAVGAKVGGVVRKEAVELLLVAPEGGQYLWRL